MNTEPVMSVEFLKSIVAAVVACLVTFGVWHPTTEQVAAVLAAVAVIFPVVQFVLVRARVTPVAKATPVATQMPPVDTTASPPVV